MAKLFLSYARKDAVRASRFADWLEQEGHDVWRDDDDISGGASFSSEIETALKDCDAVLVLWSQSSHDSAWVRDEAAVGRDAGKLIPFSIDQSEAPLGFRQFQTIDLSKWKRGEPQKAPQIRQAIGKYSAARPSVPTDALNSSGSTTRRPRRPLQLAISGLAITAIAGVTGYFLLSGLKADTTTISIVGDPAGSSGSELASTISAELAPVLVARAEDATIIDPAEGNGEKPDFQLRIAITPDRSGATGRLALTSRNEAGIIWSRNWNEAGLSAFGLKQQMSFAASIALLCALEGEKGKLTNRKGALGFYVEACTQLHDSTQSSDELINLLTKTVERVPGFAQGWVLLAIEYSWLIGQHRRFGETVPRDLSEKLQNAIEKARMIDPNSAGAYLAEGLAQGKATRALPFMDRAVAADPRDPVIRNNRSAALMAVGRQAEAVMDSRKSIELSPPSPALVPGLISTLMYAGRSKEAQAELAKAEQLWPNNPSIRAIKFEYELAYGDPRIAQDVLPSLAGIGVDDQQMERLRKLIRARIDPRAENIDSLLAELRRLQEKQSKLVGRYIYALGLFNKVDETFQLLAKPGWHEGSLYLLFSPQFGPLRADPRFMKAAADLGLVSYWRSSGKWPDFCADPDLPYDCKAEAAKYS